MVPYVIPYGTICCDMVPYGSIYDHLWSFLVPNGPIWSRIALYCPVWSLTVQYGLVWSSMVQYGPVWSCMVPYGVVKLKSFILVMTQLWLINSFNSSPDRCLRILNQAGKGSNMPNKEYCLNQPYFFILNIKKL